LQRPRNLHGNRRTPISTNFAPNPKGYPLSQTRLDTQLGANVITEFGWNARGQLKLVKTPTLNSHTLDYDDRGLLSSYATPTNQRTYFNHDLDRLLQGFDAPGTDDVLVTNDPVAGRPSSVQVGTHTNIALAYYGQTGA
jgi:YD repeat-containing protein